MNKLIFPVIMLILSVSAYSQTKQDSLNTLLWGNPVPIYEYGAPLTSCETNFENLFKNWTTEHVTNAREFQLLNFSLVETLTDTVRYNYYRNYFSGSAIGSSASSSMSSSSKMKNLNGTTYEEKTEISERFVRPTYYYSELFDPRGYTTEAKKILSEEFKHKVQMLLLGEMNIDTMNLIHTAGEIFRIDTIKTNSEFSGDLVGTLHAVYDFASTDSISKRLFELLLKGKINYEKLSIQEKRALLLEEILAFRISCQSKFNKLVHFGDKVYVVNLRYYGTIYPIYMICNPDTKKVVMDTFFYNITIRTVN